MNSDLQFTPDVIITPSSKLEPYEKIITDPTDSSTVFVNPGNSGSAALLYFWPPNKNKTPFIEFLKTNQ